MHVVAQLVQHAVHQRWALSITVPLLGAQSLPLAGATASASVELPTSSPSAVLQPIIGQPGPGASATVALPGKKANAPYKSPTVPPINPYQRDIDLTVNIDFFGRDLGEVPMHMTKDGRITIASPAIVRAFKPFLNLAGQTRLAAAMKDLAAIDPAALQPLGIAMHFDGNAVLLEVTAIDPALRVALPLYDTPNGRSDQETTALPAGFSAFLNTSIVESRIWKGNNPGFQDPSVFFSSAIRAGPFVVEGEGQLADANPTSLNREYQFDRNFVRLVYDLPQLYTRFYLGDLTPDVRFQQNYVQMGGVGFSRQRRRFDQFRSAILQGNRQLLLQQDATVDLYRNGVLFQQLHLGPGAYDLANLPLVSGSNDIRLAVHDSSGVSQTINYQTYLDPIDLDPGDYEAGAYLGKMANQFGLSPKYDGQVAFTGFYRKAFVGHPAIGFGLQASKSVQQASAQTQFLIGGGARLDLTGAGSKSTVGKGFMIGLAYDLALDQGARSDTVSLQATYQSRYFTGLGAPLQTNSSVLSAAGSYTHSFGPNLSTQLGLTFAKNRQPLGNDYRLYAEGYFRLSKKWYVRGGVDYQRLGQSLTLLQRNGIGCNVGLVFQPSAENRAEARYNSRLASEDVSFEHSPESYVGAVGYGGVLNHEPGQTGGQGSVSYLGDRFDASLSHSLFGANFGQVANSQITSLRVGTALAFADGTLALSRRINDSFAILVPHSTLDGRSVISGQSLADNRYLSKSGKLGGAVDNFLSSYVTQTVQYDVENPPIGYDLGSGVSGCGQPITAAIASS